MSFFLITPILCTYLNLFISSMLINVVFNFLNIIEIFEVKPMVSYVSFAWSTYLLNILIFSFILIGAIGLKCLVVQNYKHVPLGYVTHLIVGLVCLFIICFDLRSSIVNISTLTETSKNTLLLNSLNLIHPPLLYTSLAALLVVMRLWPSYTLNSLLCALLTYTLALGSWWAYLEGTWGGWWGWDFSEVLLLVVLLVAVLVIHNQTVWTNLIKCSLQTKIWQTTLLVIYTTLQTNYVSTLHSFTSLGTSSLWVDANVFWVVQVFAIYRLSSLLSVQFCILNIGESTPQQKLYLVNLVIFLGATTLMLSEFIWDLLTWVGYGFSNHKINTNGTSLALVTYLAVNARLSTNLNLLSNSLNLVGHKAINNLATLLVLSSLSVIVFEISLCYIPINRLSSWGTYQTINTLVTGRYTNLETPGSILSYPSIDKNGGSLFFRIIPNNSLDHVTPTTVYLEQLRFI